MGIRFAELEGPGQGKITVLTLVILLFFAGGGMFSRGSGGRRTVP